MQKPGNRSPDGEAKSSWERIGSYVRPAVMVVAGLIVARVGCILQKDANTQRVSQEEQEDEKMKNYEKHYFQERLEKYEKERAERPDVPNYLLDNIGRTALLANNLDKAMEYANLMIERGVYIDERGREKKDRLFYGYALRGEVKDRSGDAYGAIDDYRKNMEMTLKNFSYLVAYELVDCLLRTGQREEAKKEFEKIQLFKPTSEAIEYMRSSIEEALEKDKEKENPFSFSKRVAWGMNQRIKFYEKILQELSKD